MKRLNTIYTNLTSSLPGSKRTEMTDDVWMGELSPHIKKSKRHLRSMWEENYEIGLHALKLHLLDYAVNDLEGFGCLEPFDGEPLEMFNVHKMQACRKTSRQGAWVWGKQFMLGIKNGKGGLKCTDGRRKNLFWSWKKVNVECPYRFVDQYGKRTTLRLLETLHKKCL